MKYYPKIHFKVAVIREEIQRVRGVLLRNYISIKSKICSYIERALQQIYFVNKTILLNECNLIQISCHKTFIYNLFVNSTRSNTYNNLD